MVHSHILMIIIFSHLVLSLESALHPHPLHSRSCRDDASKEDVFDLKKTNFNLGISLQSLFTRSLVLSFDSGANTTFFWMDSSHIKKNDESKNKRNLDHFKIRQFVQQRMNCCSCENVRRPSAVPRVEPSVELTLGYIPVLGMIRE